MTMEEAQKADAVSVIQESVDQLALSMFDSLRLIPFVEEVKQAGGQRIPGAVGGQQRGGPAVAATDGAPPPTIKRAVATDAAWTSRVQSLAEGVLKRARELDGLIDALPGAELREDQQMEELARLDAEGRRTRAELAKAVESADELSNGVNGSLDKLAEHMLAAPR